MTTKALIKFLKKLPDNTKVVIHNPKETRWVDFVDLAPSKVVIIQDAFPRVFIGGPTIKA